MQLNEKQKRILDKWNISWKINKGTNTRKIKNKDEWKEINYCYLAVINKYNTYTNRIDLNNGYTTNDIWDIVIEKQEEEIYQIKKDISMIEIIKNENI